MAKRWSSGPAPRSPDHRARNGPRPSSARGHQSRAAAGTTTALLDRYPTDSRRPLTVLVFLLPLIVAYDVGAWLFLSRGQTGEVAIEAHRLLEGFLEVFGAAGAHLPAVLLVGVLLVWHLVRRDPWRVRPPTLLGMLFESVLWTAPLLVLVLFIGAGSPLAEAGANGNPGGSIGSRLTISIGAGIYEELLFRLLLLEAARVILRDLFRLGTTPKGRLGCWLAAAVLSAAAFTVYHEGWNDSFAAGATFFAGGLYLAVLYQWRGFGVVVGTHAAYDVLALVVLPTLA